MKKLYILFILLFCFFNFALSEEKNASVVKVFESKNNKYYGLKTDNDVIIVDAKYKKLIKMGENAWIFQKKNNKFGLLNSQGEITVEPKYSHVERLFDKWVKFGNNNDFGIYNEKGENIVPPKFSAIEPLFGGRFLTYKNYKYGIYSNKGEQLLPNEYDFIYMPDIKTLRIKDNDVWYEVEQISNEEEIIVSDETIKEINGETFKITKLVKNTGFGAGYGIVTAADYTLKIFSSFSEAYEETIDELMFSKGVETINIFIKFGWIPKFPFVFAKKYYNNIFEPNNSPLSEVRSDIKNKIK